MGQKGQKRAFHDTDDRGDMESEPARKRSCTQSPCHPSNEPTTRPENHDNPPSTISTTCSPERSDEEQLQAQSGHNGEELPVYSSQDQSQSCEAPQCIQMRSELEGVKRRIDELERRMGEQDQAWAALREFISELRAI